MTVAVQKSFDVDVDYEFMMVVIILIFDWGSSALEAALDLVPLPAHPARQELSC